MRYQFGLNINYDKEILSPENGLDYSDLAILLRQLNGAINVEGNATLFKIDNHGYTAYLVTENKYIYQGFLDVHKNIYEKGIKDLNKKEAIYARSLNKILGATKYLEPLDNESMPLFRLDSNVIQSGVETYNSITNQTGIITEIGSFSLDDTSHIYLNGVDYKIYITASQNNELKQYYKGSCLSLKIKQRISIKTGKVISAKLIAHTIKPDKTFHDSLSELDRDDLSFLNSSYTKKLLLISTS